MGLSEYRRKRDFRATAEPPGEDRPSGPHLSFVVQKHAASHLHYDFRLELDGVLKSWAVPKGPSLDPAVKRLAVHVEDHPLEYADFEGIIPKGEYGGGTVMVWDRGRWLPTNDPHAGYRKGDLKFDLEGEKLRGGWHLVRSRRADDDGGKEQWLLFKNKDGEARPGSDVVEEEPQSVKSGRSIAEIAAEADDTWHSNRPAAGAKTVKAKLAAFAREVAGRSASSASSTATTKAPAAAPAVEGARKAPLPREIAPELATLDTEVPPGDDWLHEIKLDGYRLLVTVDRGKVRIVTRKGNDWTDRFSRLVERFQDLPVETAVLDGEVVALTPKGLSNFNLLQNAIASGTRLFFYAFDLLYLNGYDLRGAPLVERKEALRAVLAGFPADGPVRFSDHVVGNGKVFLLQACRHELEGIISKRASSKYIGRRTRDWLKVKCLLRQEFVIGGYTEPKGSRQGFGSLLLGVYDGDEFVHVGRAGTGFDEETLRSLHRKLAKLKTDESPFANLTRKPKDVTWVRPELVAEVAFAEWTPDDVLRHPTFQGLREDKDPREVVREIPGGPPPSPAPPEETDDPTASGDAPPAPPVRRGGAGRGRATGPDAEVAGVRITNPNKPLFPEKGITKLALASYYAEIAEWMLPHVGTRPLTLVRCPHGIAGDCFYQKHADDAFSDAIGRVTVREKDGEPEVYTYVESAQGLVGMVQMAVLELHTSNARIDDLERPDRFVIDLDPAPDVPWARVVESAREVRDRLEEIGLRSWVKTTGGKGLHVVVPLARRHGWDEVKEFSRSLSIDISGRNYGSYITKATLAKRKGKIFLDYLRNGRGATSISAFCVRARPSAAVSVPLAWDELTPSLQSDHLTPDVVIRRLRSLKTDPWADYWKSRQTITKAMREAVGMK